MWPEQSAVMLRFFRVDSFRCATITHKFRLCAVVAASLAVTMTAESPVLPAFVSCG
jgi:hypothetical protein